jgi:hypothetical protein
MFHVLVSGGVTCLCMAEEVRGGALWCMKQPTQGRAESTVCASSKLGRLLLCLNGRRNTPTADTHATRHTQTTQAAGRRIPFAFLDDVRTKFLAAHGEAFQQVCVCVGGGEVCGFGLACCWCCCGVGL